MNKFYSCRILVVILLGAFGLSGLKAQQINQTPVAPGDQYWHNIEMGKLAWSTLVTEHPFYTRPPKSKEEWKRTTPKADRPDLAMEQDFLMTMDPVLGHVPYDQKIIANRAVDKLLIARAVIPGIEWQERGPNNVGGRSRAIMFDPNDGTNKKCGPEV
ncbi:MAG: hypothetical protein IPJ06_01750 [Saprospiraceae bacterium]|nr:hypothetical protein [Saprospiraceae bacterium]